MATICSSVYNPCLPAFSSVLSYRRKKVPASLSKRLFLTVMLLFFLNTSWSQSDYSVHANIIYHFTKYIDWSADKKTGDFVIGVIGSPPLYNELKSSLVDKAVRNQPIIIRKFTKSATTFDCQILFIGEDERNSLKRIATVTAGTSTLLVTESEGSAYKGSCINFIIVEDRLKLEINKANIEKRNLKIATELLNLAIVVK